jgi:hypothetical protein
MSFLLHAPKKLAVKPIHAEPPTTLYIVLVSVAIFLGIILVTNMVYTLVEGSMSVTSVCKDKIIEFSQHGMYSSPEQFKLALSYCEGI